MKRQKSRQASVMGSKRPAKLAALQRTVKMLLGAQAKDDVVSAVVKRLSTRQTIFTGATGDITYRL